MATDRIINITVCIEGFVAENAGCGKVSHA